MRGSPACPRQSLSDPLPTNFPSVVVPGKRLPAAAATTPTNKIHRQRHMSPALQTPCMTLAVLWSQLSKRHVVKRSTPAPEQQRLLALQPPPNVRNPLSPTIRHHPTSLFQPSALSAVPYSPPQPSTTLHSPLQRLPYVSTFCFPSLGTEIMVPPR